MPFNKIIAESGAPASITLQLGQRVRRGNSDERGTVVDANEQEIKVKWDRGATSYFRRGAHANVRTLPDPPPDHR